ncbi:MAG: MBL fold metallo-hydrolase [Anaerolineae bacterium]|nr:MBL fold metallo-hydrolase [Anaerolineae bacterium]
MAEKILEQLLHPDVGLALCWLGNLSWLIASHGRLVAFDLDLDLDLRLHPSPVSGLAIAQFLDVLFITHEHGDHFNAQTAKLLAEKSHCLFVLPSNCVQKAQDIGVPESRRRIAQPGKSFNEMNIDVEPLRALHGDKKQAVYRYANLDDCGYVLTIDGKRLLQPGDSVLLQDHLELTDIDILFISPTEHNMHINAASTLIQALQPAYIFPQHFGTYQQTNENKYWTAGYPDELRSVLPIAVKTRFYKLEMGQVFYIKE